MAKQGKVYNKKFDVVYRIVSPSLKTAKEDPFECLPLEQIENERNAGPVQEPVLIAMHELEGEELGLLHHEVEHNWRACLGQPLQDDLTSLMAGLLGPMHFRRSRAVNDGLGRPKQRGPCRRTETT